MKKATYRSSIHRGLIALAGASLLAGCSEYAPAEPEATTETPSAAARTQPADAAAAAAGVVSGLKVNLNTATREQFLALPEVTEKMAHEFDEYRPYASIRQFRREIGKYVDEAQIARYEKFVFVPIVPNEADVETLQQVPGLDTAKAEAIVAGRPYADADAFLAALGRHVKGDALEIARAYVAE